MTIVDEITVKIQNFDPKTSSYGEVNIWDRRKGETYKGRIVEIRRSDAYPDKLTVRIDSGFSLTFWLPVEPFEDEEDE